MVVPFQEICFPVKKNSETILALFIDTMNDNPCFPSDSHRSPSTGTSAYGNDLLFHAMMRILNNQTEPEINDP